MCDEIFLVMLQEKFDVDHSWERKGYSGVLRAQTGSVWRKASGSVRSERLVHAGGSAPENTPAYVLGTIDRTASLLANVKWNSLVTVRCDKNKQTMKASVGKIRDKVEW